jgi:hypothetical protein
MNHPQNSESKGGNNLTIISQVLSLIELPFPQQELGSSLADFLFPRELLQFQGPQDMGGWRDEKGEAWGGRMHENSGVYVLG